MTAIQLEPGFSLHSFRLLILFHLLVAAGLLLALPPLSALIGMALAMFLLWRECRAQRLPQCITRHADGAWWLDEAGPFMLQPGTFVTPWLVVLNLGGAAGTRRLALLRDCLLPHQWRSLRVLLRTESGGGR